MYIYMIYYEYYMSIVSFSSIPPLINQDQQPPTCSTITIMFLKSKRICQQIGQYANKLWKLEKSVKILWQI